MEKIKWSKDKHRGYWWTGESVPYASDGFEVYKDSETYCLRQGYLKTIGRFRRLSSAKQVANLLRNG